MTAPGALSLDVEALSPDVLSLYRAGGLQRLSEGSAAIDWTFRDNPLPFCVARSGGQPVGLSAYVQTRMKLGAGTGIGLQAVDSYVAEAMRGQGLFSRLARSYADAAAARGADLIWGFPNDNAAPAWFGKLGWARHGQVPFLIRPLRAGYFLRRLGLRGDFPLGVRGGAERPPITGLGDWTDALWESFSQTIGCATIRDRAYLAHRLFDAPQAEQYRVVAEPSAEGALVATRKTERHGARLAYLMEAMGQPDSLSDLLRAELARLRADGTELALAWSLPWSPNYRTLRACGFLPLPERFRPIRIWFGARPVSPQGTPGAIRDSWYLSYLDSDTI